MFQFTEDFLDDGVSSAPTEGTGFERDYMMKIERSYYQIDPKYNEKAKNKDGKPTVQWVCEGFKVDPETLEVTDQKRTEKRSVGSGFALSGEILGEEGKIQMSRHIDSPEGYSHFSGNSQYGRFIKDLTEKWEKDEDNENKYIVTHPGNDKVLKLSPTGYRFWHWLAQRGMTPGAYRDAELFVGMTLQFEGREQKPRMDDPPDAPKREETVPCGLVALEGYDPNWGIEGGAGEEENVQPKKTATAAKTTETKGAAKKETAKATTANGTGSGGGAATTADKKELKTEKEINDFKVSELVPLAVQHEGDPKAFRLAAMALPEVKGTKALMSYVCAPTTFSKLTAGET